MDEITNLMLEQIREVEQRDEGQILSELAGETINEYYYEIIQWDKKEKKNIRKVKLSWAGVKEVARWRGNIMLSDPTYTETDEAIRFVVKATDLTRNFTVFGGCHQPKTQKINIVDRDGVITGERYEPDPYYFTKGLSKCQRNALNLCIPSDYTARCIDRFLLTANKPPLQSAERKQITQKKQSKPDVKPLAEWEKVRKEEVPTLVVLEKIMWDLAKLQPKDMYGELGYSGRSDVNEPAWDCFLRLKERFAPVKSE